MSLDSEPAAQPTEGKLDTLLRLSLLSAVAWSWAVRLRADHMIYVLWSDRDLMRASVPWSDLPSSGAELSYAVGARVPGGAQYPLMKIAQSFHDDPTTVFRWLTVLDIGAGVLLYLLARRLFGGLAAAVALAVYASSPVVTDSLSVLWNPSFMPLFLMIGWWGWSRTITDRNPWYLVPAMVGMTLAAHMHLSALALFALMAPTALLLGPARQAPAIAVGAAISLATYVPYLVDELGSDWNNTRRLLDPQQTIAFLAPSVTAVTDKAAGAVRLLGGAVLPPRVVRALDLDPSLVETARWAGPIGCVSVLALAPWLVRRLPTTASPFARRVVDGAIIMFTATLLMWAQEPRVSLTAPGDSRYVLTLLPGLCLASAGAFAGARVLAGRLPFAAPVLMGFVAAVMLGRLALTVSEIESLADRWRALPNLTATLDHISQRTGRSLDEVAASTVFAEPHSEGWAWAAHHGIDDMLRRRGLNHRGSTGPPCTLVLVDAGNADIEAFDVERILQQRVPGVEVLARERIGKQVIIQYTRARGPCHSGMSQRYLPSPREKALDPLIGALPSGEIHILHRHDTGWSAAVSLPRAPDAGPSARGVEVVLGVDLDVVGGGVRAVLWGNHLRGHAFNDGFFANGLIGRPCIVLRDDAGREHHVDWNVDLVGAGGVLGPLETLAPVPAGSWSASLAVDVVPWSDTARPGIQIDDLPRQRMEVKLPGVQVSL